MKTAMTNNNSNPPNAGTIMLVQDSSPPSLLAMLTRIAEECEEEVGNFPPRDPRIKKECKELGTAKHACCARKLEDANEELDEDGKPQQQVYSEPAYQRATGKMIPRKNPRRGPPPLVPRTQSAIRNQARGYFQSGKSPYRSSTHAIGAMVAGKKFADFTFWDHGPFGMLPERRDVYRRAVESHYHAFIRAVIDPEFPRTPRE